MAERAALITGASSGIGLAIARALGEEGYSLTVAARRPEKLETAAEGLRGEGYEVLSVPANMTSEEEIVGVFDRHKQSLRAARRAGQQRRGRDRRSRCTRSAPSSSTCSSESTCGR